MILTGEDILQESVQERNAHLAQITELTRIMRPKAKPLDVARLAAINEAGRAVFYCVDGKIVGCAQLAIYPHFADYMPTLESVVVDPAFRKRGIARMLVQRLIDHAKKRKLWRVVLLTEPENIAARKLYKSLGFAEVDMKRMRLYL